MNGPTHRLVAGVAAALYAVHQEKATGQSSAKPLLNGLGAAVFTGLPDLLEPATSPNHRQFFHSVTWAVLLISGVVKLREWHPTEPGHALLKDVAMIAAVAYLIHLALDATTSKSLPLLGRL